MVALFVEHERDEPVGVAFGRCRDRVAFGRWRSDATKDHLAGLNVGLIGALEREHRWEALPNQARAEVVRWFLFALFRCAVNATVKFITAELR